MPRHPPPPLARRRAPARRAPAARPPPPSGATSAPLSSFSDAEMTPPKPGRPRGCEGDPARVGRASADAKRPRPTQRGHFRTAPPSGATSTPLSSFSDAKVTPPKPGRPRGCQSDPAQCGRASEDAKRPRPAQRGHFRTAPPSGVISAPLSSFSDAEVTPPKPGRQRGCESDPAQCGRASEDAAVTPPDSTPQRRRGCRRGPARRRVDTVQVQWLPSRVTNPLTTAEDS